MDFAAKHIGYVLASYGVAFVLLAMLIGIILVRMRMVKKRLAELEAQGASRRAPARTAGTGQKPARVELVEGHEAP